MSSISTYIYVRAVKFNPKGGGGSFKYVRRGGLKLNENGISQILFIELGGKKGKSRENLLCF